MVMYEKRVIQEQKQMINTTQLKAEKGTQQDDIGHEAHDNIQDAATKSVN